LERERRELREIQRASGKLVPLGIPGFDISIGGGIPDGSLVLLIGGPGSHHKTFAQQALYNYAISKGKVAYYITEVTSADVRDDMMVFGWDVSNYIEDNSWLFINVLTPDLQKLAELIPQVPYEQRISLSATSLNPLKQDILTRAREGRWTCLGLSYLVERYEFREITDLILYWTAVSHTYGGIHFAVLNEGMHDEKIVNALKHLSDGVFEFTMRPRLGDSEGILTLRKLRRTLSKVRTINFIVNENGIAIETVERIA
jgi:KaiC/GvpD/RAD55 family RecA-like ATPase